MKRIAAALVVAVFTAACSDLPTTVESEAPAAAFNGEAGSDVIESAENGSPALSCAVPVVPAPSNVTLAADVTYNVVGGQALRMDIARPKGTTGRRPLVVFIHGGGWDAGSKIAYRSDIQRLTQLGYVAASIDYRLATATGNKFPAAISDVRCAIRWLRANAGQYNIDPNRIAVAGHSAGAHLASLLALTPGAKVFDGPCQASKSIPVTVNAVIAFATPSDFRVKNWFSPSAISRITKLLGHAPAPGDRMTILASPRAHANRYAPPHFLAHATGDPLISVNNSRGLRTALAQRGVPVTLTEIQSNIHDLPIIDTRTAYQNTTCGALNFLATQL